MVKASVQGVFNLLVLGFGLTGPYRNSSSESSTPIELEALTMRPPLASPVIEMVPGTISVSSSISIVIAEQAVLALLRGLLTLDVVTDSSPIDLNAGKLGTEKMPLLAAEFLQKELAGYLTDDFDPNLQKLQAYTDPTRGFYGIADTLALFLSYFQRFEHPENKVLLDQLTKHIHTCLIEHPDYSSFAQNITPDVLAGRERPNFELCKGGPLVDFLASDSHWSFWLEWYQSFLYDEPLDRELRRRVALLPSKDWEKGPEQIARKIEEIKATYLIEKLPLAEEVIFNPESAQFQATPRELAKPDLLGATVSQVEDALEDALALPSNGITERSLEYRKLTRTFRKYGNDPQRIEMDFTSVHAGLTRQIISGDLPPSEENLALQSALEEGAKAVRATHPEVAENRRILTEQHLRELTPEQKNELEAALPVLQAVSSPELAEEWAQDIPALVNDAVGPVPNNAPRLPGSDEATRIFSRAAKIGILLRSSEIVHKIDGSAPYKAAGILATITSLVSLGLMLIV